MKIYGVDKRTIQAKNRGTDNRNTQREERKRERERESNRRQLCSDRVVVVVVLWRFGEAPALYPIWMCCVSLLYLIGILYLYILVLCSIESLDLYMIIVLYFITMSVSIPCIVQVISTMCTTSTLCDSSETALITPADTSLSMVS